MAYFDSAKNRAMWQRELASLDRERERRAREGYSPDSGKTEVQKKEADNPFRKKITFVQLEQEEAEASRKAGPGIGRTRERSVSVRKDQEKCMNGMKI